MISSALKGKVKFSALNIKKRIAIKYLMIVSVNYLKA